MDIFLWMILIGAIVGGMVFFINRDKGGNARLLSQAQSKDTSDPVSEMIRIIESGEGFTFRYVSHYDDFHYVQFGENNPEIAVSLSSGGTRFTDQGWMTRDERIALVDTFYQYLEKNKLTSNDQERGRWCKMLGVNTTK